MTNRKSHSYDNDNCDVVFLVRKIKKDNPKIIKPTKCQTNVEPNKYLQFSSMSSGLGMLQGISHRSTFSKSHRSCLNLKGYCVIVFLWRQPCDTEVEELFKIAGSSSLA